jgi:hypothetical protein
MADAPKGCAAGPQSDDRGAQLEDHDEADRRE